MQLLVPLSLIIDQIIQSVDVYQARLWGYSSQTILHKISVIQCACAAAHRSGLISMADTLDQLELTGFTAFQSADLRFSPGLNVVVGDNGTGKTHILKAAYSVLAVLSEGAYGPDGPAEPTKAYFQPRFAEKFVRVFRPEQLGRLASRKRGRARSAVTASFSDDSLDCAFSFATQSRSEVTVHGVPGSWLKKAPVYLPTRELLTIYPGFVPLYEHHYLEFEETWRDTCLLLGAPTLKGPREEKVKKLLEPLEEVMNGRIALDGNGRFYLKQPGNASLEMGLVAEGWRKVATIAHLIANGSLLEQGYLFWDEPESNLNPRLIRKVARTIMAVAEQGVQVFIATHSLFLLRELELLASAPEFRNVPQRYFGLKQEEGGVEVTQSGSLEDVDPLVLLDEELAQSDRFMDVEIDSERA